MAGEEDEEKKKKEEEKKKKEEEKKKKKKGGRTGRKTHSKNLAVAEQPSVQSPTVTGNRREEPPSINNKTMTGTGIGLLNAPRPSGGRSRQQPKPKPQKKTKRKKGQKTLDETVDEGDDNAQPSMLIEIPQALMAKTSRSMMGRPVTEECSRQGHPKEQLLETNQALIDNCLRKTWPVIGQDFLRDHKEAPGVNALTRYVIAFNVPPDSDFYDANRVDIPGVEPKFIIASAPTQETKSREDFWRMVYDSNVTNIYYMENKPEIPDSEAFIPWTPNDGKDYGKMFVNNKKASVNKRDAQAVLEVLPEGCSNSIIVRFAQSISWPDKVTIESEPRKSVLHIVRLLKDEKGPVLVVCKTGLARSCMFVLVHSLITLLNAKALRDPLDVLLKLRSDRWGAIQQEQQYLMAYQALIDYIQVKTQTVKNGDALKKTLFDYCNLKKTAPRLQ